MPQSLSQVYVHAVFHVKYSGMNVREQDLERLFAYIAGVIKQTGSEVLKVGGMPDHVHLLCSLSRNISIAQLMERVKKDSSRWIKGIDVCYGRFQWQGGYGAFSVSPSLCDRTIQYIANQAKHHHKMNFAEEYKLFLEKYGLQYDNRYLLRD